MNQKELNEIRRRLKLDKNSIGKIYGCYVGNTKEVISSYEVSLATLTESECEKYLSLLKKTLSGALSKNLLDIEFSNEQILESEEYKILLKLHESEGRDADTVKQLFDRIINTLDMGEQSYLILLATDKYDVPYRASDGTELEDSSDCVFTYFICAVCPVSDSISELGYSIIENAFRNRVGTQVVSMPELGFMFPTFDDRKTNIYNTLFYSKDASGKFDDFISTLFNTPAPMSATEQKDTFENILTQSLENDFDFDVVQSVHEQLRERVEQHKESKAIEPLEIAPSEMGEILRESGVDDEKVEIFKEKCSEQFESTAKIAPTNIVDVKKFELKTPQVKISVAPDFSYSIETRIIDGRKYILIPADEGVEVNGIEVNIKE